MARKKIGVFIGKNFFDYLTDQENLEYYRQMKGVRDRSETERVLELVGLANVDAPFGSFSMGMKQRPGIANAMLGNPEILILDEPVNGLDPQGIADIRDLITALNRDLGTTVITSSHILGELEHTAQRFGIIDQGRVLREIDHESLKVKNDTITLRVSDRELARHVLAQNAINGTIAYVLLSSKTIYIIATMVLGQEFFRAAFGDLTRLLYSAVLYSGAADIAAGTHISGALAAILGALVVYVALPTPASIACFNKKELEF